MPQQILDRHRTLGILKRQRCFPSVAIRLPHAHLNVLKLRQILSHRGYKVDLALFRQHHHSYARDRLRHRSNAKNRIRFHSDALLAILIAHRLLIDQLPIASHEQHGPRNCSLIDIALEEPGNSLQTLRRESNVLCAAYFAQILTDAVDGAANQNPNREHNCLPLHFGSSVIMAYAFTAIPPFMVQRKVLYRNLHGWSRNSAEAYTTGAHAPRSGCACNKNQSAERTRPVLLIRNLWLAFPSGFGSGRVHTGGPFL